MRGMCFLLLASCGRWGFDAIDHGPDAGGAVDESNDARDAMDIDTIDTPVEQSACFGTGLVTFCLVEPPTTPLVLTTMTINTDTSPLCAQLTARRALCARRHIDFTAGGRDPHCRGLPPSRARVGNHDRHRGHARRRESSRFTQRPRSQREQLQRRNTGNARWW